MKIYCRGKEIFAENHVRFGASGLVKEILDVQKTIVLERSFSTLVQKTRANKLVLLD